MLVNIASRYDATPSMPRSRELVFYSCSEPDFMFHGSASVRIICQSILRPLSARWELSHNMMAVPIRSGLADPLMDNSFLADLDMSGLSPGFYDLKCIVKQTLHKEVSAITTFGWRAGEEPIVRVCPTDFSRFWSNALHDIHCVDLNLRIKDRSILCGSEIGLYNIEHAALPENYDPAGRRFDDIEVYRIDFASPCGGTVEGWYSKPAGAGTFPGMLVYAGAGNSRRPAPVEHARHGYAALDIQVHGFPVDATDYPRLPEYSYYNPKDNPDYRIYLNALQAVNALYHLPGVDTDRIAAIGGSQGGRLSAIVAALDPRIRAAVPALTHFAYVPWTRWVNRMNREKSSGSEGFHPHHVPNDDRTRTESYFDVLNFAPYIRCPVLMNAGLIDLVSPPTATYAAFRELETEKQIIPLPNLAHDWSPAFDRYAWTWLNRRLDLHISESKSEITHRLSANGRRRDEHAPSKMPEPAILP